MNQAATPRRFTLLDGMFLVAVTAIGLGWNRLSMKDFETYNFPWMRVSPLLRSFNLSMWVLVPHLSLWTLAILALGLRRPPNQLSEVVTRPGMAACVAAALAITFDLAWYIPFKMGHPGGILPGIMMIRCIDTVTFAIGGAWAVLAVGSLWKAERHWIDRAGRVLGVAWVIVTTSFHFRDLAL
jgi:hypothetical protein